MLAGHDGKVPANGSRYPAIEWADGKYQHDPAIRSVWTTTTP